MPTIEEISRAVDPVAWDDRRWTTTRADVEMMHSRRQAANEIASRVAALPNHGHNLANMVAALLEDASRRQEIEPNAGTEARIAEAVELLERVRGES